MKKNPRQLLIELGMQPHLVGFIYTARAIDKVCNEPLLLRKVTSQLYPAIAQEYQTTATRVERAIRHAIERTFDLITTETVEKVFGNTIEFRRGKPTNAQFIATLVEYINAEDYR